MKKIICLVMILSSLLTVTTYAGTTLKDISGTKYEDAVNKLIKFEIVNGFDDNTYKPNNKVTRAQLSKMLVTAMGMQDEVEVAKKKYLDFSDVLSSYWGYGYIKIASDKKIVNGYENGTFKPEGQVTYGEATTMVVRALGYEEAVNRLNLTWPNNYLSYADEELNLFESISEFKANAPATRGDIALLIWNALRTGTAEVVGEIVTGDTPGLVWGEGTPMVTEYLGYTYIENAEITRVLFDDEYKTAAVTLKEEGKKAKTYDFNADEVLEMYGKKVTMLYDEKTNEFLTFETESDYKVIRSEVGRISDTKIYISSKTTGYKIPDEDNILLFGIEELDEACEVILLVDGTTAKYCIAMGATDVEAGYVIDNHVKIDDDEYGIKIRTVDMTKGGEEYILANDDEWPSGDSIILYYINDDDMLDVLKVINPENASTIAAIEDDYIKVSSKKYYEFDSTDDYTVIISNGTKLKSAKLSDIDPRRDGLVAVNYNRHYYFFIFQDAVIDSLDDDVLNALYDLEYAIEDAEELDEEDYSQKSFAELMNKVIDGKELDYYSSVSALKKATTKIENAIEALEPVKRKEMDIVSAKKELRALVNDEALDIIEDEEEYTKKSFADFYEAYDDAVTVLSWTNADLEDVETAYEDLEYAIDDLEYDD